MPDDPDYKTSSTCLALRATGLPKKPASFTSTKIQILELFVTLAALLCVLCGEKGFAVSWSIIAQESISP